MRTSERLKGLDTFVAVADAGSFTAAAERLSLTNSAVGKAIARLEERLQQQLFNRTTRRLELTDAGHRFYRVCSRVLDELEEVEQILSAEEPVPSGRLRIGLPATFGRLQAMPALLEFSNLYPLVIPHISFTDRFVDLLEDGLDVVVRIGGTDAWPTSVGHSYLGQEELIFCASPDYLARHGEPGSQAQLLALDAVLYGRVDGSVGPWLIRDREGRTLRQHMKERVVIGQAEAQIAAVEAGLGVAQLATWLVQEQLNRGTLVRIMPQLATAGLPLHIVWQKSREHSTKVQALIDHLEQRLHIRPANTPAQPPA